MVKSVIRFRGTLLVLAAVLAVGCYFPASQLHLDRTIETMFAPSDPLLPPYQRLKDVFGGNDIVLCVYDDPQLLAADGVGVRRLEQISRRLESIPGVDGILSLERIIGPEVVDPESPISRNIRNIFEGYTHGADGRTASVACMLSTDPGDVARRREIVSALRDAMHDLPDGLDDGIVTGEPVMMVDAFRFVERDGQRLAQGTTLLLGLVILFLFRSLRWVAISVAVVQLALLLTNGLLSISGLQLTMVSSMLTAVVTVVGVATVVHIIVAIRERRSRGQTPLRAVHGALRQLAVPIFWACLTDAVGFAALLIADVAPVRDFGLMMALGALMVMVSAILLVPGLALWNTPSLRVTSREPGSTWLDARLRRGVRAGIDHPRWVAGSLLGLTALAALGNRQLEIETDFTRNFRSHTNIVKSYELVEARLGGAGVCDIVLPAPQRLTWPYLRAVLHLEDRLREEVRIPDDQGDASGNLQPGLTKVVSLADAIVGASPIDLERVPSRRRDLLVRVGLAVMHDRIPEFYEALSAPDPERPGQSVFRIMIRARERQPAAGKLEIIRQVKAICAEELPETRVDVTGYFVLLTNLVNGILQDQWKTFGLALAGIFLTMGLALRRLSFALIALIPNAVPILLVNGLMGGLGWKVNMGAAMIAAVSLGLSIDSSIHYLLRYQRERRRGASVALALEQVQASVGRALVLATLALIVGFSVLGISEFVPTVYFGVLISLAMLGGLVGNLLWLPFLILVTDRNDEPPGGRSHDIVLDTGDRVA